MTKTDPHSVQPIARNTAVDAVAEQLRTRILTGALAPGVRLPAERELAERFGVNRLTLRAALSRLEGLGLIETQHGTGTVVRDFREHGGVEMLPALLKLSREGDPQTYLALSRDVLELRRTVAAEAVALAAERHTAADVTAMRAAARAQQEKLEDPVAFARGDMEFAKAVVRAARNLGLELLMNTLARMIEQDEALARAMYPKPREQAGQYDTVIALVESRDGAAARGAMRSALEAIDKAILSRVARGARSTGQKKK